MSLQYIADEINNTLGGLFDTVQAIGRDTIANDSEDKYVPADNKGLFLYVTVSGENDFKFDLNPITSRNESYYVTTQLTAYIFGCCDNIGDILFNTCRALTKLSGYDVELLDATTNKEAILGETNNNALKAARVLFNVRYEFDANCQTPSIVECLNC